MPKRRSPPSHRRATSAAPARAAAAAVPLSVVILAAGQGKRMKSALPKVLQPLAGRPLLKHVIDTARSLEPATLQVVYGHGGEAVRAALAGESVAWALQAERLGTGHAVVQAMPRDSRRQPGAGAVRRRAAHRPRDAGGAAGAGRAAAPGAADRAPREPDGLRPHRAQRARPGAEDRRGEGRDAAPARHPRVQHRRARSARAPAARLAGASHHRQRAAASTTSPTSSRWRCATGSRCVRCSPPRRPRCSASTTRRSWRSSRRSAARARRRSCWLAGVTLADPARRRRARHAGGRPATCSSTSTWCSRGGWCSATACASAPAA